MMYPSPLDLVNQLLRLGMSFSLIIDLITRRLLVGFFLPISQSLTKLARKKCKVKNEKKGNNKKRIRGKV